jgi:pimeloyl-ACP methyl ester carboxylesterase
MVMIHGGQFGDLYALDHWSMNLPTLTSTFSVEAFDRLGQGHTDNPTEDRDFSFDAVMRHASGFLKRLGRPAHLVGHSRGALVAAELAVAHQQWVTSLTIISSSTVAPPEMGSSPPSFYEGLAARARRETPERAAVLEVEAQSFSHEHVSAAFARRRLEVHRLPKTEEVRRRMAALRDSVWTPSLTPHRVAMLQTIDRRGLPVPTLLVWGLNDPSARLPLGLALLRRVAAKTNEVELLVLNRAGHYVFREQPVRFNRALTTFALTSR